MFLRSVNVVLLSSLVLIEKTIGKPSPGGLNENPRNENDTDTSAPHDRTSETFSDLIEDQFKRLKIAAKDCKEQIASMSERIKEDPAEPSNYRNRGICLLIMGDFERASFDFKKYSELLPESAIGTFFLGEALYELRRFEEARENYEKTLRVHETNKAVLKDEDQNELLNILFRARQKIIDIEEAKKNQSLLMGDETGIENEKEDDGHLPSLAPDHLAIKDCESEIASISEQIALNANEPLNYRRRGICYLITRQFDLALEDFEEWTKIEPKSAVGAFFMGETLFELGRADQAHKYYQKVLHISETDEAAFEGEDYKTVADLLDRTRKKIELSNEAKQKNASLFKESPRDRNLKPLHDR